MLRLLRVVLALACFGLASCSEPQSSPAELIHTGDWSALTPADIAAVRPAGDDLEITLTDSGRAQIAADLPHGSAAPVRVVIANRVAGREAALGVLLNENTLIAPGAGAYFNEAETALSLADPDGAQVIAELWRLHGAVRLQPADYAEAEWRADGVTLRLSAETADAMSRLNAAEPLGRWMLVVYDRHLASAPFTLTVAEDQIDAIVRNEVYREAWREAVTGD